MAIRRLCRPPRYTALSSAKDATGPPAKADHPKLQPQGRSGPETPDLSKERFRGSCALAEAPPEIAARAQINAQTIYRIFGCRKHRLIAFAVEIVGMRERANSYHTN